MNEKGCGAFGKNKKLVSGNCSRKMRFICKGLKDAQKSKELETKKTEKKERETLKLSDLVKCAKTGFCTCQGTVYYGSIMARALVKKEVEEKIQCDNLSFGSDPAPGLAKACYCKGKMK